MEWVPMILETPQNMEGILNDCIFIYIEGTKTKHTNIKRERERDWLVLVIMVTEARKKHKALRLQFFLP
jgi:hypothetical protein